MEEITEKPTPREIYLADKDARVAGISLSMLTESFNRSDVPVGRSVQYGPEINGARTHEVSAESSREGVMSMTLLERDAYDSSGRSVPSDWDTTTHIDFKEGDEGEYQPASIVRVRRKGGEVVRTTGAFMRDDGTVFGEESNGPDGAMSPIDKAKVDKLVYNASLSMAVALDQLLEDGYSEQQLAA